MNKYLLVALVASFGFIVTTANAHDGYYGDRGPRYGYEQRGSYNYDDRPRYGYNDYGNGYVTHRRHHYYRQDDDCGYHRPRPGFAFFFGR